MSAPARRGDRILTVRSAPAVPPARRYVEHVMGLPSPAAAPWRIGIEDPHDPSRLVAVVPVHTGAVATSGAAHRGAHIVDARTGRAPRGVASVTVVGASLTAVDIDATAAFALGADAARWLEGRGHDATVVVRPDGTVRVGRRA